MFHILNGAAVRFGIMRVTRHRRRHVDPFGDLRVSEGSVWSVERIEVRRLDIATLHASQNRSRNMKLTQTDRTYRQGTGLSRLAILQADGSSWAEAFEALSANPGVYHEVETSEFVGVDDSGVNRTPSIATIQKTLDSQAWLHGIILGFAGIPTGERKSVVRKVRDENRVVTGSKQVTVDVVRSDAFMITVRQNVTKLPKGLRSMDEAKFGAALRETAADDDASPVLAG